MEEPIKTVRRRPFLRFAICAIIAIVVFPCLYLIAGQVVIAWAMTHWISTDIKLPDRSGHVKFMVQAKHHLVAEFDRQIRIETKSFPSTTLIAPIDGCGDTPVDVYWYPGNKQEGPYLRFVDPSQEYILDLKHGGIRQIARIDGHLYVGKCTDDLSRWEVGGGGDDNIDFGDINSPVPKAYGLLAEGDGRYMGSITYSMLGCRFKKSKPTVSWRNRDDL